MDSKEQELRLTRDFSDAIIGSAIHQCILQSRSCLLATRYDPQSVQSFARLFVTVIAIDICERNRPTQPHIATKEILHLLAKFPCREKHIGTELNVMWQAVLTEEGETSRRKVSITCRW